jgi:putative ABC transport system ATP-binding protein
MENSLTLCARGIQKVYREGPVAVAAVRRVDLALSPGTITLLMGPSGSGKTTLLSMLGCILRPTAGELYVMGQRVIWDERYLPMVRRRYIGFIFQHYNLLSSLTAAENVAVSLRLRERRADIGRARALLERVGLGHRWNFLPRDLSGGEKQRVAIARALAGNPPILLADEPTGNLDSASGRSVVALLKRAAVEEGRSIFIVSHDARIAEQADRVLMFEDGRLVSERRITARV